MRALLGQYGAVERLQMYRIAPDAVYHKVRRRYGGTAVRRYSGGVCRGVGVVVVVGGGVSVCVEELGALVGRFL